MKNTTPVFFIGSGRSGTRAMVQSLKSVRDIEIHHEYLTTIIQTESAKYFMGLRSTDEIVDVLRQIYGSAIFWSPERIWADSSHKLTWLVGPLSEVFPNARFVNIVRDGRKVAGSFFRKLSHEIYEPESMEILISWLRDRSLPEPPPEKRFWWNVPSGDQPFSREFHMMGQFERCCYHWVEANRAARESLSAHVAPDRVFSVRLEDLVQSLDLQVGLANFLELDCFGALHEGLKNPKHVLVPTDERLTADQLRSFERICREEMDILGYDLSVPEYLMQY